MPKATEVILKLENLKTYFPVKKGIFRRTVGHVKAVDGVDLEIYRGETLGLVGESGCGKATLGKSILQLVKSTDGKILLYDGENKIDLRQLDHSNMKPIRKKLQIVFQDPHSSLNPAFTVFGSLQDLLKNFGTRSKTEIRKIIGDLLEAVNMRRDQMDHYPHEFSGGQRQRIGIARALCVEPELIVCDEAVSALDVSIQAQVLKLLKEIKDKRGLTYIFITHDLSVVEYISDRVAVMYLGKIMELAESDDLYSNALHPYTKALLSAVPLHDPVLEKKRKRTILSGDVPSPADQPSGCHFSTRCPVAEDNCFKIAPEWKEISSSHRVACHLV